ncbi:MAG TPA: DNA polymerase III subunit alpha [Candidatus Krumholzibacteria bacterium]|nr:DNA polymerase III subunit alpha [Candidatus Krumholzibacteria bacterium]
MSASFVHLHAHSEFSLLDGSIKVKDLVGRAKQMEMPAVALTDHGNLFGMIHFYKAAKRAGIKPILGMEAYITRGSRHDRGRKKGEPSQTDHLILLARNLEGYHNLIKLSSIAYLEGFYYKPRIDFEVLQTHSAGLIGTTACLRGTVAQLALNDGYEQAKAFAYRYRDVFGAGNYYIEMQNHGLEPQIQLNEIYRKLSKDTGIPAIVSNDVHYLERDDSEAHEALLCLQTGSDMDDPKRFRFTTKELYFKSPAEMAALFPDDPGALENTLVIADQCDVTLKEGELHLPRFPLPEGFASNTDYLRHLAYEGAARRYPAVTEVITQRLDFELSVIKKMGFDGYFLIVRDIVHHARSCDIPVGPGRGSAAGSLVTYSLGITDVDPLAHDLLFERMLNPERVSMPDIDIDFCFERRDEVIRYVIDRYGKDNVCQIITFGTMAARAVVRDVGRVLKVPYDEVDRIAKLIPGVPGTSLRDSIENISELKTLVDNSPDYARLMKLSLTLEGVSRHASTHAAGMIITPTPLVNHVPLYKSSRDEVTTQYDMKSIDAIGLLKIDVLGLRTLTVIDKALRMVEENHGRRLRTDDIPYDDEVTFDLLRAGRTVGVFQLESSGMRELLKNLRPTGFHDVVAVNALYRPGPLGSDMVTTFVDCKHGRKEIVYDHELLEPILRDTYGVILYQEQVMRIASDMAGFSLGEADLLRKAMGKKQKDVMGEQRKKFIEGARARGIAKGIAEKVFSQMEKFAEYGFNKSHSAAYAVLSIRTAYIKAHYAAEFLAATLSSEIDNTDRIMVLMDECREFAVEVVPPSINACEPEFRARDGRIFYGLAAVKNVGMAAIEHIVAERNEGGAYRSLENLCARINSRLVTKRVYESLIASGALDCLPGHRAQKLAALETVMERAARRFRDAERGQFGLFGESAEPDEAPLPDVAVWAPQEKLQKEKESLGLFLSGHPMDRYRDLITMVRTTTSRQLRDMPGGERALIGGMVSSVKFTTDRNQRQMAFVTIEDPEGSAEVVMFSDILEKSRRFIVENSVVVVEGRVSRRNGGDGKVLVNSVMAVGDDQTPSWKEVHVTIDLDRMGEDKVDELKGVFAGQPGDSRVFFHIEESGRRSYVIRARNQGVRVDPLLVSGLSASVGASNVRLIPAGIGA